MLYGSDIGPMDQRLCQRTCQDEFGLQHQEGILDLSHYLPRWDQITPSRQVFISNASLSFFKLSICAHAVKMGSD